MAFALLTIYCLYELLNSQAPQNRYETTLLQETVAA